MIAAGRPERRAMRPGPAQKTQARRPGLPQKRKPAAPRVGYAEGQRAHIGGSKLANDRAAP